MHPKIENGQQWVLDSWQEQNILQQGIPAEKVHMYVKLHISPFKDAACCC